MSEGKQKARNAYGAVILGAVILFIGLGLGFAAGFLTAYYGKFNTSDNEMCPSGNVTGKAYHSMVSHIIQW